MTLSRNRKSEENDYIPMDFVFKKEEEEDDEKWTVYARKLEKKKPFLPNPIFGLNKKLGE